MLSYCRITMREALRWEENSKKEVKVESLIETRLLLGKVR